MSARLAAAVLLLSACTTAAPRAPHPGQLRARPQPRPAQCASGNRLIGTALLYVPQHVAPKAPLLLLLHGAGGDPTRILGGLHELADEYGVIVVAPKSTGTTWDGILGAPGRDADAIDAALASAFVQCSIDRRHIATGGFSDGASYALTLGVANGDLFTHVLAFSACIVAPGVVPHGRPRIFLSHGREDRVMPVGDCGSVLARRLRESNYRVTYEEFDGRHELPESIARDGFRWFTR